MFRFLLTRLTLVIPTFFGMTLLAFWLSAFRLPAFCAGASLA